MGHRRDLGVTMKSPVVKRSIVVCGHKTSVSLEDGFWLSLKEIARSRRATLSDIIGEIDSQRSAGNLSSTIRLFVLDHYRAHLPVAVAGRLGDGLGACMAAAEEIRVLRSV